MADGGNEYALPPGMGPQSMPQPNPSASAGNKLAGVYGIPPSMGAQALVDGQTTGVHPDIALQAPQPVGQLATDQKNQAVINSSQPVRDFLNSTNDAHAAVVQNDLPGLAKVGQVMSQYAASGGPFGDIAKALGASFQALQRDVPAYYKAASTPKVGGFADIPAAVNVGKDVLGVLGSPFAAITEPLAKGEASIPLPMYVNGKPINDFNAKLEQARKDIGLAMFALGPGKARAGVAPLTAREAPAGPAPIDLLPGPGGVYQVPPEVPRIGVSPEMDTARGSVAAVDAAAMAHAQENIAATQTHSISPQTMEEFLKQQPSERTVGVNPDTLVQLQAEGHDPFPEHAADIQAATASGEDVEIPLSRYLTRTAGQPFAEQLNNATVFREGGTSVDEAAEGGGGSGAQIPAGRSGEQFTPDEAPRAQYLAEDTRDEMEKVVKAQFLQPLFQDPAAIGMTKGQFERYNAQIEDAISTASDKALQRAYDQIRRERTPEWVNAVKQHSAAVEQELARSPAIVARSALMNNRGPLGEPLQTPALKMDKTDALALHGKDLGLPDRMFSKNGSPPDEVAAQFGYASGADMLRDLDTLNRLQGDRTIAEHMKEMIRAEAENRARAQLGFNVDPEEMYNEASRLLNGPKVTDFLATELRHLADVAGLPFDKAAVKALAQERFAAKSVAEATNLKKLEGFVYKGGVKAEKALLKGDAATAFLRKQQQFIHHLQLAEAHKFIKYWTKTQRQWGRVAKKVTMKGVSQDALNWSKDIIASTGREVKGNPADLTRPIAGHHDISSFIATKNDAGADIPHAPIPFGTDARAMTVAQYRGVADMLAAIMKWGREENLVTVNGQKMGLRQAVDEGIASLARYTRTITDRELADPTLLEKIDAARRVVDSWLVRNEQLMRDFGARDPNSPFFQVVSRRLQERKGWSSDTRAALAKHFHALTDDVGKGFDRWLKAKLPSEGPHTTITTSDGSPLFNTNKDIMMAALHMGDTEALDKFARGYGVEVADIERAVYANATRPMWTAVQGIWDSFEKLKPEIEAMYRRITAVTPRMVEPRPFTTPDGLEMKGGYFPVMYDVAKMPKDWVRQEDPTSMLGSPHYVRATPSNKYIEQRTGVAAPIQMDLQAVYSRLNQVVHDLAYREVLADMNKFLLHPDMVQAITHKYGPEYVHKLREDMKAIAGSESVNPNEAKITKAIDYLSEGQMINMIGFSLSTMAKHGLTAQLQAMSEVGVPRYLASLQRFLLQPRRFTAIAERESHDVRHVLSTINEDAFRQFMAIQQGKTSVGRSALSFAFHFVAASNKIVAVPLYDAAKLMIADKHPGMDEATVQAAAGQIVRQALGSSGATDAPMALRMGGGLTARVFRLTNPFMTFLSHMYNKQREIPQSFGFAGERPDIGRGLGILMASVVGSILIDQIIARKTFSQGKKLINVLGYWAEGLIHQEFGGIPMVNTATAAAVNKMDSSQPGGSDAFTEIGGAFGQVGHDLSQTVFHHKRWTDTQTKHVIIAGGYVGRYPGVAAARVQRVISKIVQGKEDFGGAIHDLVLGEKPKK